MRELLNYTSWNEYLSMGDEKHNLLNIDHDYIPIYAMDCHRFVFSDISDCFFFQKPAESESSVISFFRYYSNIKECYYDIKDYLKNYSSIKKFGLMDTIIGFSKGYIENCKTREILMCLCTKDHSFITGYTKNMLEKADPSTFKLFISEKFFTDSDYFYKVLLDILKEQYFPYIRKYQIDIVLCDNVEDRIFNKQGQHEIISFSNIDELQEELSNLNRFLSYDFSYYNTQFISDEYGLRLDIIDDLREIELIDDSLEDTRMYKDQFLYELENSNISDHTDDFPF